MKAFHTKELALVKHMVIVSKHTVTASNPEKPKTFTMKNQPKA
jgi:hypothetical protein